MEEKDSGVALIRTALNTMSVLEGAIIVGRSLVLDFRVSFVTRVFLVLRQRTVESAGPHLSGSPVTNTRSSMVTLLVISRDVEPGFLSGWRMLLGTFVLVEVWSVEESLDILKEIIIAILILEPDIKLLAEALKSGTRLCSDSRLKKWSNSPVHIVESDAV